MSTIITDSGFASDDWAGNFVALDESAANDSDYGIDLGSDTSPEALAGLINAPMIRIDFPTSADGRGFTLAAMLRRAGFSGRLRAKGHVLADQYAMARRSGFDEVEIDDALAARQPEDQWLRRTDWRAHDYQSRMRG
ncbi:Uncharacterized conserved protein, DUF934 family [Cognatiyoonia sediminum]|uniref:Uncharacterized conserved protein, DUF934 family n=1 Tax=Cognatiyoonia sediminum TaxID=1508389 RepID=A0A1M5LI96_9RHOB|nr:DUF934 domain-containing protein [Cognatiyoonia sediminum]SHG64767.1 Uncharacterized conserved protein, DUF934 family [Cognatiyoonia sediminum]